MTLQGFHTVLFSKPPLGKPAVFSTRFVFELIVKMRWKSSALSFTGYSGSLVLGVANLSLTFVTSRVH